MALKVGIVGAGSVGTKLGGQLVKHNAALVKYGSRDPTSDKVKQLLASQPGTSADTIDSVVQWSDAVILATPGAHDDAGTKALAASLGAHIIGKVLIDATNPLTVYPGLEVRWNGKSAGEVLAEALPNTLVFKAFNTIGAEQMEHADGSLITGVQLTMLYAGPAEGKDIAEKVIAGVGFKPEYVGPIRYARNLEALAELWIHLGVPGLTAGAAQFGRNFHFQVIRK